MADFPKVGDAFPDVALVAPDGSTVKPSDFAGRKLVVFFYPKDDTPGCTTENKDFPSWPNNLRRLARHCWACRKIRQKSMPNLSKSTA